MKLPNFILKRFYKNYLKIFANIDEPSYTLEQKELIIEKFIELSKNTFAGSTLKFDIDGKRIGLSKGSPLIGEKALRNKLSKFGYDNVNCITTAVEKSSMQSHLFFLHQIGERPAYCEIVFTWNYESDQSNDRAISLFHDCSKIVNINYGYAYLASFNTSLHETKTNMVSVSYRPKSLREWDNKIKLIKDGAIKKIYPVNCLNKNQKKNLTIKFQKIVSIKNSELEICMVTDK